MRRLRRMSIIELVRIESSWPSNLIMVISVKMAITQTMRVCFKTNVNSAGSDIDGNNTDDEYYDNGDIIKKNRE